MSVARCTAAVLAAALSVTALAVTSGSSAAAVTTGAPTTAATAATVTPKVPGATPCCGRAFLSPGRSLHSDNPGESTMSSGGLGVGRYNSIPTSSPYYLTLQTDGNLVEYKQTATGKATAVWSTRTTSSTPVSLVFQSDGNVVLYNAAQKALWSTGTAGRAAAYFDVYGNGQVVTQDATGRVLTASGPAEVALPGTAVDAAFSPAFITGTPYRYLDVQSDGNLVEYEQPSTTRTPRAVWSSGTAGAGPVRLAAQSDGNLVLYQLSTGRAVWNSRSHGPTAYYQLDVQDDGTLVLYRTDGVHRLDAVWSTGIRR